MQEVTFLLVLLGSVAVLWTAGWFSVKWFSYWFAKRGLRGKGGEYQAWRPWLLMLFFGIILAVLAWWATQWLRHYDRR